MGLGSWFGRQLFKFNWPRFQRTERQRPSSINAAQERTWLAEQIKTYAGAFPLRFGHFQDNITHETPEIRASYRLALIEPTVKATLIAKVLNVAQLELTVNPASKRNKWDKHIAEFTQTALRRCKGGVPQIVWNIAAPGLVDGWSLTEKVSAVGDQGILKGRWTLAALKSKDTKYLWPITDNYRNVIGYQASQGNQGVYLDSKDFVHFNYMSFFENPLGLSDLRAAYRAIQCKLAAIKLRMMFLDRYTGPWMMGRYRDTTMRAELEAGLAAARASGYITIPDGTDVQLLNLAMSGTADFAAAIDAFDKEIAVSISGAHLQVMEGVTNNGAGDTAVHKDAAELFVWYLSSLVTQCIQEQIVPDLVVPNFGKDVDFPEVKLSAVNPKDIISELAIDEALQRLGIDLSKEDLYDRTGRAPGRDANDNLPPPNRQQVQGGFGGQPGDPQQQPPTMGFSEGLDVLPIPGKAAPKPERMPDPESDRVDELLAGCVEDGRDTLARILSGVLSRGQPFALSAQDATELTESLGRTEAVAELLGRFRAAKDSEESPFEVFAERSLAPQSPEASLDYLGRLSPLGVEGGTFAGRVGRQARAVASEVEGELLKRLAGLEAFEPQDVPGLLDEAGVSERDPHYAWQVFGKRASDAYNRGLRAEAGDREGLPMHQFADRSHLVKKVITNRVGKKQTVWVNPNQGKEGETGPARRATKDETEAKRAKREENQANARKRIKDLVEGRGQDVTPEELAGHVAHLTRDELRDYAKALAAKVGGRKVELAQRIAERAISASAAKRGVSGDKKPSSEDRRPKDEPKAGPYYHIDFPAAGAGSIRNGDVTAWTGASGRRYVLDRTQRPSDRLKVSIPNVNGGAFEVPGGREYFASPGSAVGASLRGEMTPPPEGPKEGDTKDGLVFKDGRWHKQNEDKPSGDRRKRIEDLVASDKGGLNAQELADAYGVDAKEVGIPFARDRGIRVFRDGEKLVYRKEDVVKHMEAEERKSDPGYAAPTRQSLETLEMKRQFEASNKRFAAMRQAKEAFEQRVAERGPIAEAIANDAEATAIVSRVKELADKHSLTRAYSPHSVEQSNLQDQIWAMKTLYFTPTGRLKKSVPKEDGPKHKEELGKFEQRLAEIQEFDRQREAARKEVNDLIRLPKPASHPKPQVSVENANTLMLRSREDAPRVTPEQEAEVRQVAENSRRWLSDHVAEGVVPHFAVKLVGDATCRAHAGGGHITVDRNDREWVHLHELGHEMEFANAGVRRAAQDFLKHRVGDETPVGLRETLGSDSYDSDEKGRKDDFGRGIRGGETSAYYVGKDYGGHASEITSMGMQAMFDDPAYFIANDPEYAAFILGVMRGKYSA